MVSLQDCEAAVALIEERHFGRAARRLNVSQPALTSRLRRLEDGLGTRLFDRSRSGVEPTATGFVFVEGARRMLDAAAETIEATRSAQDGFGLTLRVGMTHIAACQMVAPSLDAFRIAHPGARLQLFEGTTASLERDLEQNLIDVAFLHPPLHARGLSQRELTAFRLTRRHLHADGVGKSPVRYPRHEAPILMGDFDRHVDRAPIENRQDTVVEADTAIGALVLSAAGYGPAIVPGDFPAFGFSSEAVEDEAGELVMRTGIAWRALDRRPVVKALVEATIGS